MQAVINIAGELQSGMIDVGIGAGVESMSSKGMGQTSQTFSEKIFDLDDENAANLLTPMGMTSENVADKYGVSRAMQDQLAVSSHAKATKARATGRFRDEIV
jgi:acetyl-CoA acyltransferase 1